MEYLFYFGFFVFHGTSESGDNALGYGLGSIPCSGGMRIFNLRSTRHPVSFEMSTGSFWGKVGRSIGLAPLHPHPP